MYENVRIVFLHHISSVVNIALLCFSKERINKLVHCFMACVYVAETHKKNWLHIILFY